jgi:WD40 repeat protein
VNGCTYAQSADIQILGNTFIGVHNYMRTRLGAVTIGAVLIAGISLVDSAQPASAQPATRLPISSVGGVVVDGVHKQIFISDPQSGKIVATGYDGTVVATRSGLPGVAGISLSPDAKTLYGAVRGADSIVSLATETLTETARYDTGTGTGPKFLAYAGGLIWFGYDGSGTGDGATPAGIGSLDPAGAAPTVVLKQDKDTPWLAAPRLAATPAAPGVLAAGESTYSDTASRVAVFDVSTGTARRTAVKTLGNGRTDDLALTPDGKRLITARAGGSHEVWKVPQLSSAGTYRTEWYADAVAVADDGTVATGSAAWYDPDVHIFAPGSMTALRRYDFPNTGTNSGADTLANEGLAWEPGGTDRLFAVTSNSQNVFSLNVLTDPTTPDPEPLPRPGLPVETVSDFVVDGVHQRVFVSDARNSTIVAADFTGKVLGVRRNLPGVQGLALAADSAHLYAAVPGADAVVSIATDTVTEAARYPTGDDTTPTHVATTAGKIWFGYGDDDGGNIGSVDITGNQPTVALAQDASGWPKPPRLAAVAGAPNLLAAGSTGKASVYDVSTGTAIRTAVGADKPWFNDLALSPDGSRLYTASGEGTWVWKTSDMSPVTSYMPSGSPNALAVAADETLAIGYGNAIYWPEVYVYPSGSADPIRVIDLPDTDPNVTGADDLVAQGLAWEPGGSRLFAVAENSRQEFILQALVDPAKSVTTLTVDVPATATRGKSLTVSGTLTASVPLPAGTPLTVVRVDEETPKGKPLGTKALGASNRFSFTDIPYAGGKVTYQVSYAGDPKHIAASAADTTSIAKDATTLTLDGNGKTHTYNKKVLFTATLGKTYQNRVVEIWADPYGGDKPSKLVAKGKVNSKGQLSATVWMTRNTTVTALFAGDTRTASRTAKATAYAKVNVSLTVGGHYKTGKIGSTKYHYFRKSKNPVFTTTMTAYKGRSQRLELEVYANGKWRDAGSEYFTLAANGRSRVTLGPPHGKGLRLRMRSSYVRTSSGDTLNATTVGGWVYVTFT